MKVHYTVVDYSLSSSVLHRKPEDFEELQLMEDDSISLKMGGRPRCLGAVLIRVSLDFLPWQVS